MIIRKFSENAIPFHSHLIQKMYKISVSYFTFIDEASTRLGNIHIGSGRCMVVGGVPHRKREHHRKHHKRKREKSKERRSNLIGRYQPRLVIRKRDLSHIRTTKAQKHL